METLRHSVPQGLSAIGVLALLLMVGTGTHPAAAQGYAIEDLSASGGYADSLASGINAAGLVTCIAFSSGQNATYGFLWNNGTAQHLGTLGGKSCRALGINDSAQVVGQATMADGRVHAFLWANAGMQDLGTLGGRESTASGINSAGQVAGTSAPPGTGVWRACRWSEGGMEELGTLGGRSSWAYGINDVGDVVGFSLTSGGKAVHAFRWSHGVMQDLGTLGGTRSLALGINGAGQVVGWTETGGRGAIRAFRWSEGVMRDLGTLGGRFSFAHAINDAGEVVGSSTTVGIENPRAFLYTDRTGLVDLNTRIDPASGWELQSGYGINAAGQIVGVGKHRGQTCAFRLTPFASKSLLISGQR